MSYCPHGYLVTNVPQSGACPQCLPRQPREQGQWISRETWSDDLDRKILELKAQGLTIKQIAEKLARSRRSIDNRLNRLRLRLKQQAEEDQDVISP